MQTLLTETRDPQSKIEHASVGIPVASVGHRLISHAREALAAGDELVAVLMLRMAYEAFDRRERGGAV